MAGDEFTESVDRGSTSIAREHLLGATVWAYADGAARVRPWTQTRQLSKLQGCVNA